MKMSLASRQENVALAGIALRALCLASGFDAQTANLLQLALEEAVTNAIGHAYLNDPRREVEVCIEFHADRLSLVVSDRGLGMAAWPAPDQGATADPPPTLQEGGRGIFFINHIMDSVSYRSEGGGNHLAMSKYRPKP